MIRQHTIKRIIVLGAGFVCLLLPVLSLAHGDEPEFGSEIGYPTFLSPHSSPIVRTGDFVFVVNTAADTLDVIDAASRELVGRVRVGIDPVSLAVRPDGKEVWVSNHVSDSVSVIDTDPGSPTFSHVIATIQDISSVTRATRFDEPSGIAFASNEKAYVALSSENQIAVIDVESRQIIKRLNINAQDPRAIRVRGGRLYVIPFESNNQTQISGCVGALTGDLCTFDATEHVVTNNNVLSRGIDVDLIKHPQIPDRDLYIYSTANEQLLEVVDTLGTLLYGIAVDSNDRVFIAQTDARNDVNGRAGTLGEGLEEMENRAFLNQLTRIDCAGDCAQAQFIDLEPTPPSHPAPGMALATPFAIEISDDDATLVVSAAGSNKIFTLDADSGSILGRIEVGKVPRGIALESDAQGRPSQAWVFNAVDNSVSVVDLTETAHPQLMDTITLEDPTQEAVKRGRIAFNDAEASTTGTFSCESCHPDGGTDQIIWILDTPICDIGGCTQIPPRITMPIRGLRDTAPYHWDGIPGDPFGGNNTSNIRGSDSPNCSASDPASCTLNLVDGGLASTMCMTGVCPLNDEGKDGALTSAERDDMSQFLLSVPYPPAQRRAYDDRLSNQAKLGFQLFHIDGDLQGDPQPNVCGDCHRMPFWVSTNTPGTGMEAPTWRGAYDRWLILPQGRLNIIDFNFYSPLAQQGIPERSMWRLSWANRSRFDPVWDMVLEGSTGFSGSFARNLTLNQTTAEDEASNDLLDALELSAREEGIVLQGEGVLFTGQNQTGVASLLNLEYRPLSPQGMYFTRDVHQTAYSRSQLQSLAQDGSLLATFTARLGKEVDVDHPQPALWSQGPMQVQRGPQVFPTVFRNNTTMVISGRHVENGAGIFVDGRRVAGDIQCQSGDIPDCNGETMVVTLASNPEQAGIHLLQVQNPDGLFSNDYIFHSSSSGDDNCPDIPNQQQSDTDGDGIGDRCDDDAFDFDISPAISGNWYDPDHSGEGWFVEVLDESRALVYWFTHTPPAEGRDQAQAWIGGIGEIQGSSIVIPEAMSEITSGPAFGPDYDPERVIRQPWGKIVLSFESCQSGVMYYQSNDLDYGSGSLDLSRLTTIGDLGCETAAMAAPSNATQAEGDFEVGPAISGAWLDTSHDGEGWLIEMLDDGRALVAWFSYDPEGNQAWFYNTGVVSGHTLSFDLLIPSGTDFGPSFNSADIDLPSWGTATFTFDSCNSGTMSYESSLEDYGSGVFNLTRLTALAGQTCQ